MSFRALASACTLLFASTAFCQMGGMNMPAQGAKQPAPSPAATAGVTLGGQKISVAYSAPSLHGRHLGGPAVGSWAPIVPMGEVWRTGANAATTLVTPVDLTIGSLKVPAGTYTLFTLPSAGEWQFIVSKKTGEWGIPYPDGFDLGRTPMMKSTLSAPQQVMSISFEKTSGHTTQMHVKWDTTDVSVKISTP